MVQFGQVGESFRKPFGEMRIDFVDQYGNPDKILGLQKARFAPKLSH